MGGDIQERLRCTECHVVEGAQNVDRQRELVEALERSGRNAATERRILRQLEAVQALQVADLGRLQTEAQSLWQLTTLPTFFRTTEPTFVADVPRLTPSFGS